MASNDKIPCPCCDGSGQVYRVVADVHTDMSKMHLIIHGIESEQRGEGIRWQDLKRKYQPERGEA